jgi:hypothetical protein
MAVNRTNIEAKPEVVFGVLSKAENYGHWVVGSSQVRHEDPAFPAVGSKFGQTVGIGPLGIDDTTDVLAADPPRRLVLRAKSRPLAVATVRISLAGDGNGTEVTIDETLDGGLGSVLPRALSDPLIKLRNTESLRRLKRMAELP